MKITKENGKCSQAESQSPRYRYQIKCFGCYVRMQKPSNTETEYIQNEKRSNYQHTDNMNN